MYTRNVSSAYTGEVGSEMKTPPVLATPDGADRPLPTVADCSAASHQLGCAFRARLPIDTDDSTTAELALSYRLTTMADVREVVANQDDGRYVLLQ